MKTRTLLSVIFILAVVSLLSITPAFASEAMDCPHPEPTISALLECVAHAAGMGHIDNQGIANSLLAKLKGAQSALERGQAGVAMSKLEAFIHEVEAQAGKHIDAMHAEHMKMHAQEVIHALGH